MAVRDGKDLLNDLERWFGYDSFRPQQHEVIERIESGGDALVLMPTGGGKSLCYQLPAVRSEGLTVVVSPLIALMEDQVNALQDRGIAAAYLNSSLSLRDQRVVAQQVLSGQVQLVYVAPERVNTDSFRDLLIQRPPSLIAIDEAHCISQWGHEFRPDYLILRRLTEHFVDVPTIACTATATPRVQQDIIDQLDRPRMQTFATGFMRDNLKIRIVRKRRAVDQLAARLHEQPAESAIVYSTSRKSTEATAADLRAAGINAEFYHAGLEADQRRAIQHRFQRGETPVICATIAFGMGIDKPDIRLVAHLDMPASIEDYYQQIGRAGRDGEPSECLMFFSKGVWHTQMHFIEQIEDDEQREQRTSRLRTMMNFSDQSSCRWATILKYFGNEPDASTCVSCDNCLGDVDAAPPSRRESRTTVDPDDPPDPPGVDGPRPLTNDEEGLYEELRQLRAALASRHATAPYVIASNRDLAQLSRQRPQTLDGLTQVKGFGRKRASAYGNALLEVIRNFTQRSQADSQPAQLELETAVTTDDNAPPQDWQQRFNALAEWRTMVSERESCDTSELLSYAAMRQLAEHPPESIAALAVVDGVGALVAERFADDVAAIIGIGVMPEPSPEPVPEPAPAVTPAPSGGGPQSWQVTVDLYEDGHTVSAIAERRMLSPSTVVSHLVTGLRQGVQLDLERSLPPAEHVSAIQRELMRDPNASNATIHEQLEQRVSRPEVTLTIAHLRPPEREQKPLG